MQDRKMMVQIAKPENAGPENAGLKNDRLEFDGPEQCAVMSLHWSRSIMYTLKTVSISSCRQTYFETVIFYVDLQKFCSCLFFNGPFQICVFV